MDRRSWLWRRKSSDKSPGETESSGGSISSHSERFSDDQVYMNHNSQPLEVMSKAEPRQSEHNDDVKTLSKKLSAALLSIDAKEDLVKQHAKVAEEAVSGWEKAESEVLALRQQVEVLARRNSTLEDRVVHLDGALKECLRQLRQTREEKDQIAHEAIEKKNSETESSLTSIDSELHHKLEMAEKENSDLKLELSSMAEELEIRLIERELSNQAAEQASKQHLDSVKKAAKFEAECRRLNSALQKANGHGSFIDSQSKTRKTPSIAENGTFKETNRFGRNRMDPFVEIDLMDDFLEMERLVALPENSEVEERLKKVETLEIVLQERENELKESRNRLEKAESKLVEIESHLEMAKAGLEATHAKKEEAESRCKALEAELEILLQKVESLESDVQKERDLSGKTEAKCRELEDEVSRLQHEVRYTISANRAKEFQFLRVKKDTELSMVGSKFAECQKTIASINRQLKTLATLDDFLINANDSSQVSVNSDE